MVSWSYDTCGLWGTRRGASIVAQTETGNAYCEIVNLGMQWSEVTIKGPNHGKVTTLRDSCISGILFAFVQYVTPTQYNGYIPFKVMCVKIQTKCISIASETNEFK